MYFKNKKSLFELTEQNKILTVSLFSWLVLRCWPENSETIIIWANDVNKVACGSYKCNIDSHIHQGSIYDYREDLQKGC